MKEITSSLSAVIKDRLISPLYGTIIIYWLILHWDLIFSIFFVNEKRIYESTKLLKNDYLTQKYFNISEIDFWIKLILPFIITPIVIWLIPRWTTLPAFKKVQEDETKKKIIVITEEKKVSNERAKLAEKQIKQTQIQAKQIEEEKKILAADPTIEWEESYAEFEKRPYFKEFSSIIESIYAHNGHKSRYNGEQFIPVDLLAYAHSIGLVNFDKTNSDIIKLTEKGKYFVKKYSEEI